MFNIETMFNTKKFMIGVGVVVLLVLIWTATRFARSEMGAKGYSVVYLTSGEIYIGHLRTFSRFELTGAYLLQNVKSATEANKTNLQLTPLNETAWATLKLYVNPKLVLFYGPLDPKSTAAQGIKAKGK